MSDYNAGQLAKMSQMQAEAYEPEVALSPEELQEARWQKLDAVNQILAADIENPPQLSEEHKKASQNHWNAFTKALEQ